MAILATILAMFFLSKAATSSCVGGSCADSVQDQTSLLQVTKALPARRQHEGEFDCDDPMRCKDCEYSDARGTVNLCNGYAYDVDNNHAGAQDSLRIQIQTVDTQDATQKGKCTELVIDAVKALDDLNAQAGKPRATSLWLEFQANPANKGCSCYTHAARRLDFTHLHSDMGENSLINSPMPQEKRDLMTGGADAELGVQCRAFPGCPPPSIQCPEGEAAVIESGDITEQRVASYWTFTKAA